ncbi:MAG: BREX-1 system phosphatase PglZ type A [Coriobacteriales bacterium]|nr:BREX-1 system phosphatase PglZ type A [Coriobacteriales bacterium]
MDIDLEELSTRLNQALSKSSRIVFWEDESRDYTDAAQELELANAEILDATGHELAVKRKVLRQFPSQRFVIYRSGDAPRPEDDLLLDIKLAAQPFTCSMEGIWADECGIPANLCYILSDHAAFFKNKERRAALTSSKLLKNNGPDLLFAMTAATLRANDAEPRDAARSMAKQALTEWARGDEQSMRMVNESGLAGTFWSAMEAYLGYHVPTDAPAGTSDLAFRLLEGLCGPLVTDANKADEAESARILGDLARNVRTSDVFEYIINTHEASVAALIPEDAKTVDILAGVDAIPAIDKWILASFAASVAAAGANLSSMERVRAARRNGLFGDTYCAHYDVLIAIARFDKECAQYNKECGMGCSLRALLEQYCVSWYRVDQAYRDVYTAYNSIMPGRFKASLDAPLARVRSSYDTYLMDLASRWQQHLMDEGIWPPAPLHPQTSFFFDNIEKSFPQAERGKRVGVIVSDALRYEAGRGLASKLSSTRVKGLMGKIAVVCNYALSTIPSYTQLGMAALLPEGTLEIDPATTLVTKGGLPTQGIQNRVKLLAARIPGSTALQAQDVLAGPKLDLAEAPLVYIYHNVVDKTGDNRDTEDRVFEAVIQAFDEIEKLVLMLVQAGCGRIIVTSDHGFLYQAQDPEDYAYADVPGLSLLKSAEDISCDHTRRFVIGGNIPQSDSLMSFPAKELLLEGTYRVAFPKGITRLKLKGSGSRFVHGGATLQENVIPVITIEVSKASKGAHTTGVEGFATGRTVITGPSVTVIVYQCEACSDSVSPQTVKVGVYTKDGTLMSSAEKTLELSSTSTSSEDRKTRVSLPLIDNIDDYPSVIVRISTRIGQTNAYESAWEQEYSVNRAFGMDF